MRRYHYEMLAEKSAFEELVCDILNAIHNTIWFQLYRGRGSNQYGVGIYSKHLLIIMQRKKERHQTARMWIFAESLLLIWRRRLGSGIKNEWAGGKTKCNVPSSFGAWSSGACCVATSRSHAFSAKR